MNIVVLNKHPRLWSHLILTVLTVLGCYIAALSMPQMSWLRQATIGTGYLGLAYLIFTLIVGPWRVVRSRRRVPVNIDLRRDVGIWAGVTMILHIIGTFSDHHWRVWMFFLWPNGMPKLTLFGSSNWIGLVATLIACVLLVLSNDFTLRRLKGPRWKFLQRFNYGVFVLSVVHTFGYQVIVERVDPMTPITAVVVVLTIGIQGWGFLKYQSLVSVPGSG